MTTIIDGKKLALELRKKISDEAAELRRKGVVPGLAVVLVGKSPASQTYVKNKRAACQKAGIASFDHDLPESTSEAELSELIAKLNADPAIHGILVQLPLPKHINERKILGSIEPSKDVDGFHPINIGRLVTGEPCLKPCTPSGIMALIDSTKVDLKGRNALVIGRSTIVGKPTALMLLERHATVTICHSKTADLSDEVRRADIVITAIGRPRMIKGSWIKSGALVIDVGINRVEDGTIVGDVDFEAAKGRAGFITPVPGGVGPMTIAMLMKNTVEAAKAQT